MKALLRLAQLMLLLVGASLLGRPVAAQGALRWTEPARIPGYASDTRAPYLVADLNRTVHAFNSQVVGSGSAIVYNQWSAESGWTDPVDILLSPIADQARITGAVLDNERGLMHVSFYGGNEQGAAIFYAWAPAASAAHAPAWATARVVGDEANTPTTAAMVGDEQGRLLIVYSGKREGNGLYATFSEDSGRTWTPPATLFLTESSSLWPVNVKIALDGAGRAHMVWSIVGASGNGETIYYARAESDFVTWGRPVTLAVRQEGGYEVDWPSIAILEGDALLVVYQDDLSPAQPIATRWMRRSTNGGRTWSTPERLFDTFIGEYGHAILLHDSAGGLHLITGNRTTDNPAIHGMWHSSYQGGRWHPLEPVISGPLSRVPGQGFDPNWPQAIISQGNVLLVTWVTDPAAGFNGVWYASTFLGTPELPLHAWPPPPTTPTATPTATPIPPETPTPIPASGATRPEGAASAIPMPDPVIVGALPALLLILAVVVASRMRLIRP